MIQPTKLVPAFQPGHDRATLPAFGGVGSGCTHSAGRTARCQTKDSTDLVFAHWNLGCSLAEHHFF